jgi:predicted transcriptional regulator
MSSQDHANEWLWSAEARAFDGPRLRRAIIARGWTTSEFAKAARVNVASVYNALSGRRVRDGTAIRIFETLEKREPMMVAVESN